MDILFVISVVVTIQGHGFVICIIVLEIHDNVDMVLCIKSCVKLEIELSVRDLKFKFLSRSIPAFLACKEMVKPTERRFIKLEVPFVDAFSGLGRIMLLDNKTLATLLK